MGIHLRTCRKQRRPPGNPRSKGSKITGMRSIDERPAEIEGRQVPGAWEGDLIIGKDGASQAGTLVERKSRFLVIARLPKSRKSDDVCDAIIGSVSELPAELVKSISWDQGVEMAQHAALTLEDRYLFRPRSLPVGARHEREHQQTHPRIPSKGTRIPGDAEPLNSIAHSLNARRRRIFGYRTPAEVFARDVRPNCFHHLRAPPTEGLGISTRYSDTSATRRTANSRLTSVCSRYMAGRSAMASRRSHASSEPCRSPTQYAVIEYSNKIPQP
jgi:IS30 family transposase